MAYNVISFRKVAENTQILKIAKLAMKIWLSTPEITKTKPQNGSLNCDLLNFLYRYGIFWMPPGESSHPGGSEYV